jgi:hypothetical protein
MVALLPLLGNTFTANALSSVLLAAILLACTYRFLVRRDIARVDALLALLVLSTGFSMPWAMFVYGEAAYGWVCLLLVLAVVALCGAIEAPVFGLRPAGFLLLAGALVGLHGTRGLVTVALPLTVGVVVVACADATATHRLRRAWPGAFGLATGLWLRSELLERIHLQEFESTLAGRESLARTWLLSGVVDLFDLAPFGEVALGGPHVALYPLRLLAVVAIAAMIVLGSVRAWRSSTAGRVLVVAHWTLTASVLYLEAMVSKLAGVGRYLIPAVFSGVLVGAFGLSWVRRHRLGRASIVGGIALLLLLSIDTYVLPQSYRPDLQRPATGEIDAVKDVLARRGVRLAFGTYWNSAILTVLSGSHIATRQVDFDSGLPAPMRFLAADRWYSESDDGPAALLIRGDERDRVSLDRLVAVLGPPEEQLHSGRFLVLIYPRNVFPALPEWQRENLQLGFSESGLWGPAGVFTQVGTLEEGALVSGTSAGALVFGPYVRLPAGRYRIRLRLTARALAGVSPGHWDIAVDGQEIEFASGGIPATAEGEPVLVDQTVVIDERTGGLPLEVRVFSTGKGVVVFHETRIERLP